MFLARSAGYGVYFLEPIGDPGQEEFSGGFDEASEQIPGKYAILQDPLRPERRLVLGEGRPATRYELDAMDDEDLASVREAAKHARHQALSMVLEAAVRAGRLDLSR